MKKIDQLLRLPQVLALTGVGKSPIYTRMKLGEFPKSTPIFKGGRAVGWSRDEISAWRKSIN